MLSTLRLLLACAAAASALQRPDHHHHHYHPAKVKSFLLFGCSLDRYAVEWFCRGKKEYHGQRGHKDPNGCFDPSLNARAGFIFHPGVGYNGDLEGPFFEDNMTSTKMILDVRAKKVARSLLYGEPDMVVVDSSFWDLAGWRKMARKGEGGPTTDEHVRQWCERDLPGLLAKVADTFPSSRIAFRTAPNCKGCLKFSDHSIEKLYNCITTSATSDGKLFGKYEIIDFHAIVAHLAEDMPQACRAPRGKHSPYGMIYQKDGDHLNEYPSLLYVNEVLRHLGATPQDPPKPPCYYNASGMRVAEAEEGEPDDPGDPDDL